MSRPKIHDYFKRKCTEWNITEFLKRKQGGTISVEDWAVFKKSRTINDNEQGKRQERAKQLLNIYKSLGRATKPVLGIKFDWKLPSAHHCSRVLHLHHPMFVDGTINGAVNSETIGTVGNIRGFVAGSSESFESKKDRDK
ncbi:4638_t:CDS:2, partial [Funneliformis mosseae]